MRTIQELHKAMLSGPISLSDAEGEALGAVLWGHELGRRGQVEMFANAMEAELKENDHKGGWDDMTVSDLLDRVVEETAEIREVCSNLSLLKNLLEDLDLNSDTHSEVLMEAAERVLSECADVANFAMMIADVVSRRALVEIG